MSLVVDKLSKKGYQLEYSDNVITGLINKGIDTIMGARGLSQIRRDQIEGQLAEKIIHSVIPRGTTFHIDYEDDSFKLKVQKPKKKSEVETK